MGKDKKEEERKPNKYEKASKIDLELDIEATMQQVMEEAKIKVAKEMKDKSKGDEGFGDAMDAVASGKK